MTRPVKNESPGEGWDVRYRAYQATLARRFLIPTLQAWNITLPGSRVLEIGCGDGGVAAEMYRAGASVVMTDLDQRLCDIAAALNKAEGVDALVVQGDVFDRRSPFYGEGPYDLVVLRDVIEHLQDPVDALRIIGDNLAPGGHVFVVFPPYYSPYGAHQQILPRKTVAGVPFNKLPFVQLLPDTLFRRVVSGEGEQVDEVLRLRGIRMTLAKFERSVAAAGCQVVGRTWYLSRPTFSLRYGMPVIKAPLLGRLPLLRELFVTAGYYLLRRAI